MAQHPEWPPWDTMEAAQMKMGFRLALGEAGVACPTRTGGHLLQEVGNVHGDMFP